MSDWQKDDFSVSSSVSTGMEWTAASDDAESSDLVDLVDPSDPSDPSGGTLEGSGSCRAS
jgi:hypothetical protein